MKYSIEEMTFLDLDCFCSFQEKVYHLATAGTKLPDIFFEDKEEHIKIVDKMNLLPSIYEYEINPALETFIIFNTIDDRGRYLESFINIAKKGIFSFDRTPPRNFDEEIYHLVAWPKNNGLSLSSLPNEIKAYLSSHILKIQELKNNSFKIVQ